MKEILQNKETVFIDTIASTPSSLDPVQSFYLRNFRLCQMLFTPPILYDRYGNFKSIILDKYSYDHKSREVRLTLKENIKYEDQSLITIEDVALAITRNALIRPGLPLIKHIAGLKKWQQRAHPLRSFPKGIRFDHSNRQIRILFDEPVVDPLDKLTMEIFGVVKSSCVNLETGELSCPSPPSSGYYKLAERDGNLMHFELVRTEKKYPKSLWLFNIPFVDFLPLIKFLHANVSVSMIEIDLPTDTKELLKKHSLTLTQMPQLRYFAFILNSNSLTFKDKMIRHFFLAEVRKTASSFGFTPQGSIFTRLHKGFLDLNKLASPFQPELEKNRDLYIKFLKENPPVLFNPDGGRGALDYYSRKTLQRLQIPVLEPIRTGDFNSLWREGKVSMEGFQHGFWNHDLNAQMKVTFAPNVFVSLTDLWLNPQTVEFVHSTRKSKKHYEDFNQHLYQHAILGVITHFSRIFITNVEHRHQFPLGSSLPYIWMTFAP